MKKVLICGGVLVGLACLVWFELGSSGTWDVGRRTWSALSQKAAKVAKGSEGVGTNAVAEVSRTLRASVEVPAISLFRDVVIERDRKFGTPRFVGRRSGYLSSPNSGMEPEEILKGFLASNGRAFTLHWSDVLDAAHAVKVRDLVTAHSGMRSVTWQQQRDGIDIFGARLALNLTKDGRIVNAQSTALSMECVRFVEDAETLKAEMLKGGYLGEEMELLKEPEAIWYPLDMVTIVKAWDVWVERAGHGDKGAKAQGGREPILSSSVHRLIVRADTGEIVEDICLTYGAEAASYRVFTDDSPTPVTPGPVAPTNDAPPEVARELVTVAALSTNASPLGWIPDGEMALLGNNAIVYADRDDNDAPDSSAPTGTAYRVFDYSCDLGLRPSQYTAAAQVQAFYRINWFHDRMWELGFDEVAGNFQSDNLGRGGVGSDPLRVEVQNDADADGLHGIAAWYTGWGDGSAGKIQIGVSSAPTRMDGALDSQLLVHEATHGVSSRLIGNGFGLSATQSRGLAEGWSDFFALALLSQASDSLDGCYPFGSYAGMAGVFANNGPYYYGIRRFPYSTSMTNAPQTLADADPNQIAFDPAVPRNPDYGADSADQIHNLGEIWCLALWECRANLMARYGAVQGNELMLRLVVDGMKLTPETPTFLEARDAVLQADLVANGGTNQVDLWRGFAKRGFGYGAAMPGAVATAGIVESVELPFRVEWVVNELTGDGDGCVGPGESGELIIVLESFEMPLTNAAATLTSVTSVCSVVSSNALFGSVQPGASVTGTPTFVFSVDAELLGNSTVNLTLTFESDKGQFEWPVDLRIGNPYDYPPEILDVVVVPGTTNALVSWNCNIESAGSVRLLPADIRQSTQMGLEHSMILTNLAEGVQYEFVVEAMGTNGLTNATAPLSFRTHSYVYVDAASTATQELGTIVAPFRSLQAAAEAAKLTGDEVRVAEGTYTGTHSEAVLNMVGSDWDVTIRGGYASGFATNDPAQFVTTIDGEMTRRGIRLDEGATLSISGVTITRGSSEWGGGVHVRMSQFTADQCVISGNASTNGINEYGGGLYATLGSVVALSSLRIDSNLARRGGGVYAVSETTSLALSACSLIQNRAVHTGGGLYIQGGARAEMLQLLCLVNEAGYRGGGIDVSPYASVEATHGTVAGNSVVATVEAGGYGGGGVSVAGSSSTGTFLLNSLVLWGNLSDLGSDLLCAEESLVHAVNSCVGELHGDLDAATGIIRENPRFADPESGDFHLLPTSPCIDAGSTNMGGGLLDMDGEPRPFGVAMDIGADEYVDADGDSMADYWEKLRFGGVSISDGAADGDRDGLVDIDEYLNQTEPDDADTDDDAMPDGWEVTYDLDPRSEVDATLDPDSDMQDNRTEYVSDTAPNDPASWLGITTSEVRDGVLWLGWQGGRDAFQILEWSTNVTQPEAWTRQLGYTPPITNSPLIALPLSGPARFYRIRATREE